MESILISRALECLSANKALGHEMEGCGGRVLGTRIAIGQVQHVQVASGICENFVMDFDFFFLLLFVCFMSIVYMSVVQVTTHVIF